MKNENISKLENNDSFKNVEKIIIHRYQTIDGTYELELQNINKVLKNTEIISEEINTNPKYVKIYTNSLKKATKPLKLEELMTQACKKQVEAATAEYKIKLEASDNRIQQLESENKDFRLGRQESDNRIQQLESESQIKSSNIETLTAKTHNLEKENLIFKRELEDIKSRLL